MTVGKDRTRLEVVYYTNLGVSVCLDLSLETRRQLVDWNRVVHTEIRGTRNQRRRNFSFTIEVWVTHSHPIDTTTQICESWPHLVRESCRRTDSISDTTSSFRNHLTFDNTWVFSTKVTISVLLSNDGSIFRRQVTSNDVKKKSQEIS